MTVLDVLDPAGAAGGEHRQLRAGLDLLEEFCRLLHDREVGGEVGVIHHVRTEAAQRGDELAGAGLVCGQTEALGHADTHTGRVLHDDLAGLILQHRPELFGLVADRDRTGRAHGGTLAAADTVGILEGLAEVGGDVRLLAAAAEIDRADVLDLGAGAHAQTAEDALARIAHDAR